MTLPDFHDIRKLYVQARSGYGTAVLAKGIDKSSAHKEFNEFVQQERDKAAQAARSQAIREGWDLGWIQRHAVQSPDDPEFGKNPYDERNYP